MKQQFLLVLGILVFVLVSLFSVDASPMLNSNIQAGVAKQSRALPKDIRLTPGQLRRMKPSSATPQPGGYASCTRPAVGLSHAPVRRSMRLGAPDRPGRIQVTSNLPFSAMPHKVYSEHFVSDKVGGCGFTYCPHPAEKFRLYNITGGSRRIAAASLHARINRSTATITLPSGLSPGEYRIALEQGSCSQPPAGTSAAAYRERGYRVTGALLSSNSFRIRGVSQLRQNQLKTNPPTKQRPVSGFPGSHGVGFSGSSANPRFQRH